MMNNKTKKRENRLHVMNIKMSEKMNGVGPFIVKRNTVGSNLT
ncbi:hypothetical protein MtrunA17_Chr2g0278411 [Medicago truncatula]|uniref:Uncharacterized protein n=1 Tax=Medicago truncatula TaxID=3880 RepID=A0A396J2I0_MEDTR|nr:hypothetical protein MtrunA17_Chr2g0278411 [Medicago truncatula]